MKELAFIIRQEAIDGEGLVIDERQGSVVIGLYRRTLTEQGLKPVQTRQWTIQSYEEWLTIREEIQPSQDLIDAIHIYQEMESLTDEEQQLVKALQKALSVRQRRK